MQCFIKHHAVCLFIMEAKISKFEADVIDLLLCSVVQDGFRTKELKHELKMYSIKFLSINYLIQSKFYLNVIKC